MVIKGMTSSKTVIGVLNHFSQCIHHNTAEEIETSLAKTIQDRQNSTPDGLLMLPRLCTGIAWDNYDELIETLSGAGTFHATFGICYQNIPPHVSEVPQVYQPSASTGQLSIAHPLGTKKMLSISLEVAEIPPYMKKPKISNCDFQIKICDAPYNSVHIIHRDNLWMISSTICPDTPL